MCGNTDFSRFDNFENEEEETEEEAIDVTEEFAIPVEIVVDA